MKPLFLKFSFFRVYLCLKPIYSAEAICVRHCCGTSQTGASVVSEYSRKLVTGNKLCHHFSSHILRQAAQNIRDIEKVTINTVQLNIDVGYELEKVKKCL